MDIEIIKFLRDISIPITDYLFYAITQLGGEIFFIIVGAIIYWTMNKKYAHKFVLTFLLLSILNLGLKEIFKRPRPYTEVGIIPPFDYFTSGYSFPSGHATAAAILSYTAIDGSKKLNIKFLKYIGIALIVLVPLSRMVLAQHYFTDVLVGASLSYVLAYYLFKAIDKLKDKEEYLSLALIPIILIAMIIFGTNELFVAGGAYLGFALGYTIEKRYIKYDVKNKLSIQIIKVIFGFIILLAIKEGLKLIIGETDIADFIRYLLIGGWVSVFAPLTFKYVFRNHQEKI